MRLQSISISNLAAFEEFSAALPPVALVQGKNGLGKTSLQAIIKYAFGRRADGSRAVEHDPLMLHGAAEKGEATLVLDDGTHHKVVVTPTTTARFTKPKDGTKWSKSPAEIDALVNALSYDPMQFKTFPTARRVETLLKINPSAVAQQAEVAEALQGVATVPPPPSGRFGLEELNTVYSKIEEARRDENRRADTLEKHAAELEAALPPPAEEPWGERAAKLRKEAGDLKADFDAGVKLVGDLFNSVKDNLAAELDTLIAKARKEHAEKLDAARAEANAAVAQKRAEFTPKFQALESEITVAEERARATAAAEGTREAATRASKEAKEKRDRSRAMTGALERLVALKGTVAGRLNIKGITIAAPREGEPVDICREEKGALVPFSKWNETSHILFCLRIAVLTHGQCGIVCIDSIDAIDPDVRAQLEKTCRKYAKEEGMQFILGEATGGPLRVKELEG
jgi:hypothetical protein